MNTRALVAEAVGTFILIVFGSLGVVAVASISRGSADIFGLLATTVVPFAFGLGLLAAIGVGGHASGGHFNPAVTLAALIDGRVTWQDAIGYVVAQIVGGLAASLSIVVLTSGALVELTVNRPGTLGGADAFGNELRAFGIELVLTAVFVAVILNATRKRQPPGDPHHPADPRCDPLRRHAPQRRLGEPGPLAGAGGRDRHVRRAVGLPDRRRSSARCRLGPVPPAAVAR